METNSDQAWVPAKKMFRPEKAEDWEPFRPIITELYATMTLPQVSEEMEIVYAFSATPKQYKTKFRDWGLTTKYVKKDEYEDLLAQEDQDEYIVRGKRVTSQDVARFKRRQQKKEKESGGGKKKARKTGGSHEQQQDQNTSQDSTVYFTGYDNAGEGPSGSSVGLNPATASGSYFEYPGAGPENSYATAMAAYGYDYGQHGFAYDHQAMAAYQQPQPQTQQDNNADTGTYGYTVDASQGSTNAQPPQDGRTC